MLGENRTQKMRKTRKTDQKTTSFGLRGGEIGLKSRYLYKAHLGPLLNVRIKFNILDQFGGELREEKHFFKVKKREKIPISPFLIDLLGSFLDVLYNF